MSRNRRREMILDLIQRSRAALGYNRLDSDALGKTGKHWDELLTDYKAPTDQLELLYKEAIDKHDLKKPFSPLEMCRLLPMKQNSATKTVLVDESLIIERQYELGEKIFEKLSLEEQKKLVADKLEEMESGPHRAKVMRMLNAGLYDVLAETARNILFRELGQKEMCG